MHLFSLDWSLAFLFHTSILWRSTKKLCFYSCVLPKIYLTFQKKISNTSKDKKEIKPATSTCRWMQALNQNVLQSKFGGPHPFILCCSQGDQRMGFSFVWRSHCGPNAVVERLMLSTQWKSNLVTIHSCTECLLVTLCFTDPTFLLDPWRPFVCESFSISLVGFLMVLSKIMMKWVCWGCQNTQNAESKISSAKTKGRTAQISPGSSNYWISCKLR